MYSQVCTYTFANMHLQTTLLVIFLCLKDAFAQNTTSVYSEAGVPTGTPVPGNYAGVLRPQIHFSPPQGFMNDPNGLFLDANGLMHLYYQYNPTGVEAGDQHWGHATSMNGYSWQNQAIAIFPPNSITYIYTGSAVIDVNNTSGFFPAQDNGVVAIFTLAEYNVTAGKQTQGIAYSRDGGYSFEMYAGNPVIDINSTQFRDPKASPGLVETEHQADTSIAGLLVSCYEAVGHGRFIRSRIHYRNLYLAEPQKLDACLQLLASWSSGPAV